MKLYKKIYRLVKKIPKGKVATYGQIGQILGINPRIVGWALNKLASNRDLVIPHIPWQRVINSKGGISTNRVHNIPLNLQEKLLKKEGVKFNKDKKINLACVFHFHIT